MENNTIDHNIQLLETGVSLSQQEKEIFDLVRDVTKEFDPPVIARTAGGWVRDKLLGKCSDDIDIAVENTSGLTFAEHLQAHFSNDNSKIVLIEANPDQSKHLETARICLFNNIWIDVCGLRSETYASTSRIPITKQGTPQEDAERRDFTLNALFFNINTSKVEDFVGGINDLRHGVLKTPLDALVSFGDDPLRILRAFRFGSRFGFELDSSIIPAARQVKDDFIRKITRERIFTELSKALDGIDPLLVLRWVIEADMFGPVFDPPMNNGGSLWNLEPEAAYQRVLTIIPRLSTQNRFVMVIAAIFQPLIVHSDVADTQRRKKMIPAIEAAVSRIMRIPMKIAHSVHMALLGAHTIPSLMNNLTRLSVGRWIRTIGDDWKLSIQLVFDDDLYCFSTDELQPYIVQEDLGNVWDLKPLLRGNELAAIYNIKPGKQLKQLIDQLIEWQLENPLGTADDYKATIRR